MRPIIDHAWGYEPCTIKDIKSYVPSKHSLSIGQVLKCPYSFEDGKLIVKEMTESLMLDLVSKHLLTEKLELRIVYDHENVSKSYMGSFEKDQYGRKMPSPVHGIMHLEMQTASTSLAIQAMMQTYQRIVNPGLFLRKITVVAMNVVPETQAKEKIVQHSFFDDVEALEEERRRKNEKFGKEKVCRLLCCRSRSVSERMPF